MLRVGVSMRPCLADGGPDGASASDVERPCVAVTGVAAPDHPEPVRTVAVFEVMVIVFESQVMVAPMRQFVVRESRVSVRVVSFVVTAAFALPPIAALPSSFTSRNRPVLFAAA